MKLCRFGEMGREKPAVLTAAGARRDVSGHVRDFDDEFFASSDLEKLAGWFRANEEKCPIVPENARWGACIARPSKIVCIGLNYARHAAETGKDARTAHISLVHDKEHPGALELPVVKP